MSIKQAIKRALLSDGFDPFDLTQMQPPKTFRTRDYSQNPPQPGISIGVQYTQSPPIGVLKFGAGGGYNANRNVFDAKVAVEFDFSKYFHAGAGVKAENINGKGAKLLYEALQLRAFLELLYHKIV